MTVTLVQITTADPDGLGDDTTTAVVTTVEGAQFDPERISERPGDDQAAVVLPAVFNVPGVFDVDADDMVLEGEVAEEDLNDYDGPTWYVLGGAAVWLDRTKIPVTQTRSV